MRIGMTLTPENIAFAGVVLQLLLIEVKHLRKDLFFIWHVARDHYCQRKSLVASHLHLENCLRVGIIIDVSNLENLVVVTL